MANQKVSLKDLLEAGAHFGHQASRWNPKMKPYLYAVRDGIHVFDLVKTKEGLEAAAEFVQKIVGQGDQIVFVGTKRQAKSIIEEEAKKVGMPYVSERWLGGTITNWGEIKQRVNRLEEMKEKREKGEYKKYTKKEQVLIDREINKLEKFFGGLADLKQIPAAIFIVDTKKESTAVREANRKKIPVVGIIDSNADPELVDYPIPANDDATGSIEIITRVISQAVEKGKKKSVKKTDK